MVEFKQESDMTYIGVGFLRTAGVRGWLTRLFTSSVYDEVVVWFGEDEERFDAFQVYVEEDKGLAGLGMSKLIESKRQGKGWRYWWRVLREKPMVSLDFLHSCEKAALVLAAAGVLTHLPVVGITPDKLRFALMGREDALENAGSVSGS